MLPLSEVRVYFFGNIGIAQKTIRDLAFNENGKITVNL